MSIPKISVCIPIYNAEKYLEECLDSLVSQTLKDIEIICVDDGSTDDSPKILAKYAKKYKNIKVVHQENQGLGKARNTGVNTATGKYIGFIDADDIADSKMYEELYDLAIKNNAEIAMCNLKLFPNKKSDKRIWYHPYKGKVDGAFLHRNTQPWNKIFARTLVERSGLNFEKNDSICCVWLVMAKGIISTDKKLYNYRVGHSSMSVNYKMQSFLNTVDSTLKQREVIRKDPNLEKYLGGFFEFRIIQSLIQALTVSALQKKHEIYKILQQQIKEYDYKQNQYCKELLKPELGAAKYFASIYILPKSYYLSSFLIRHAMGGKR